MECLDDQTGGTSDAQCDATSRLDTDGHGSAGRPRMPKSTQREEVCEELSRTDEADEMFGCCGAN